MIVHQAIVLGDRTISDSDTVQQTQQFPGILMPMLDLDYVSQVREYGTWGVSRSVASFSHESHCFPYQKEDARTPLAGALTSLESSED